MSVGEARQLYICTKTANHIISLLASFLLLVLHYLLEVLVLGYTHAHIGFAVQKKGL